MVLESCCGGFGAPKSILKGIEYKLPHHLSVTEYFRKCIIENTISGDSPAVIAGDGKTVSYTFSTLDSLSTKLAKALRRYLGFWTCNNPDGDLVMAFALPISENIPVVLLAILKLGAAFLAIPTGFPEQFIVKIVSVTRPMIVITESAGATKARYDCVSGLVKLVDFEDIMRTAINGGFDDVNEVFPLETLTHPFARIASIVFTAGTMDQQLAVRIGHSEILNRCLWQYKEFPYMEGEVQGLCSGLEDVDSIAEIFAPLLAGTPVHLIPKNICNKPLALITRIHEAKISRVSLAPPALASLLTTYEAMIEDDSSQQPLQSVKYWTISGDAMSQELVDNFFKTISPNIKLSQSSHHHHYHHNTRTDPKSKHDTNATVTLIHLYGSTEVMSDVTYETFDNWSHLENNFRDETVSIGRPIGNTIVYIVDEDMRIVDTGVIGEICVAGAAVASGGYASGTDKDDAVRFCTNPFTKKKGYGTIYLTEDFGRIHIRDGVPHLFYEGRTEMKAKVKGKRIDLREISKLVSDTKMVDQCFALCFHPGKIDQAIVAFCKLLPGITQKKLEETLVNNIKEEHLMPQVFPVEQFCYLPSGRLDKHKLLKQYFYSTMNASPEEWQVISLTPQQKNAAKVLFATIATSKFSYNSFKEYTHITLRQVIDRHQDSMWSLGVNSMNALAIYLHVRDSAFVLDIDTFLKADNLLVIVEGMRAKTKARGDQNQTPNAQKFKLYTMPHEQYYADVLNDADREHIINMISKSYATKNEPCMHLRASCEEISKFLGAQWKQIMKDNLSLVAYSHSDDEVKPVGAVIILDASGYLKAPSNCHQSIKYWIELRNSIDKGPKEHIVWKKKGTVAQIFFMGTAECVSTRNNMMIVALLLEAAKIEAKSKGYNGTIVSCANAYVSDLCEGILNYKVMEEVPMYKFRAKDKTLPFRLISEYLAMKVLYESF